VNEDIEQLFDFCLESIGVSGFRSHKLFSPFAYLIDGMG
jgi:hypothetical protein